MTSQRTLKIKFAILRGFVLFITVIGLLTVFAGSAIAQNPVPFIDQPLVPDAAAPGGAGFTLTVNGAGFVASSTVNWNGSPLATAFISSAQLTATVPASDIVTASSAAVTVVNPSPGGGVSNTQFFSITVPGEGIVTFLPAVTYGSGGSPPLSVAIADLNGDGKLDLVVANTCAEGCVGSAGVVGVLLGNGDGTFQAAVDYASGGEIATSVAIADVNGDNIPDLVVANCGPIGASGCQTGTAVVGVLLGNGDGTFRPAAVYGSGGWGADSVAVADVNGDGKLDLVVANISGSAGAEGAVSVLLGNGDGTFQPAVVYDSGGAAAGSVAVTDVNGDGKLDILVANSCAVVTACGTAQSSQGGVGVLLGNGDGAFQQVVMYDSGGYAADWLAVADVNGDGKPDLLVFNIDNGIGESSTSGSVGVLLGNGDGTFQPAVSYNTGGPGGNVGSVAVGDVDGDGKLDLLATNGTSGIGVLLGNGDGTFQTPIAYGSGGSTPVAIAAADLNGDGLPDVVVTICPVTDCGNGEVGVLLHVGATPTATTVTSAPNPSFFGQRVTFSAAVTSKSGTPTGAVVFFENSTELGSANLVNGNASTSISTLAAGSYPINAVYQGSLTFNSSQSAVIQQVVSIAATSTSLASSSDPAPVNSSVTYTAAVASQYGGTATGSVTFYDGGSVIASEVLSGTQAACTTKYKTVGVHSITATYSGDANNSGSTSPPLTEDIDGPTKTVVTTSGSPSMVGQPVTFTATVTSKFGAIPNGELVTFYDGKNDIGTGTTASGVATFTTSSLKAGKHHIKAKYAGDATFKPSSGEVVQVVEE